MFNSTHNQIDNFPVKNQNKSIKSLFVLTPLMLPVTFYLPVPVLVGQLQNNGFDATGLDLNIEFYNDVLTSKYILKTKKILEKMIKNPIDIPSQKLQTIKENLADSKKINSLLTLIDKAVKSIKSEKHIELNELQKASYIINETMKFISLPYFPTRIKYRRIEYDYCLNYDEIKRFCFDKNQNIFIDYFNEKIETKIVDKNFDLIGIACTKHSNICPTLTLARLLKEKTNAHIVLYGEAFTYHKDSVSEYPEFFDIFCDSILVHNEESSILELADCIENKTGLEDVSGIIYKDNENKVKVNSVKPLLNMDSVTKISLDGMDLTSYLTADMVAPIAFSKGCYYGQCMFCDLPRKQTESYNSIDKTVEQIVSEIQELQQLYNINRFSFCDYAISPHFYDKLSDEIIKRNLKITYNSYARLESGFTKTLLKKMHESGVRRIFWGLESGSDRILKLMNKGIDPNNVPTILKDSYEAGISNVISVMFGFPSETEDDFNKTVDLCLKCEDYIHSYLYQKFVLYKNSPINTKIEEFSLELTMSAEFMAYQSFIDQNLTDEEKTARLKAFEEKALPINKAKLFEYLGSF